MHQAHQANEKRKEKTAKQKKGTGGHKGQFISNRPRTGDHKGPPHYILSPLAPTIQRIDLPSPCIVGAGEDVEEGMGPLLQPCLGDR